MGKKDLKIGAGEVEVSLVCNESLTTVDAPFFEWLRNEGFKFIGYHGNYGICPWAYVNITRKGYAYAIPGISLAQPIGNHAITIKEFMTIYNIYKKYDGKELFTFHSERFDYDR